MVSWKRFWQRVTWSPWEGIWKTAQAWSVPPNADSHGIFALGFGWHCLANYLSSSCVVAENIAGEWSNLYCIGCWVGISRESLAIYFQPENRATSRIKLTLKEQNWKALEQFQMFAKSSRYIDSIWTILNTIHAIYLAFLRIHQSNIRNID